MFWAPASVDRTAIVTKASEQLVTFLNAAFGPLPLRLDEKALGVLRGVELTHPTDKDAYRQLAEAIRVNKVISIEAEQASSAPIPVKLNPPEQAKKKAAGRVISPRRSV
jgi:hypothetical protein